MIRSSLPEPREELNPSPKPWNLLRRDCLPHGVLIPASSASANGCMLLGASADRFLDLCPHRDHGHVYKDAPSASMGGTCRDISRCGD